jgi:hypothetical protein
MALLRAAKDQLLAGKAAPWLHAGLRNVSRSYAAQAEPLEDEEGAYVVTGPVHTAQSNMSCERSSRRSTALHHTHMQPLLLCVP